MAASRAHLKDKLSPKGRSLAWSGARALFSAAVVSACLGPAQAQSSLAAIDPNAAKVPVSEIPSVLHEVAISLERAIELGRGRILVISANSALELNSIAKRQPADLDIAPVLIEGSDLVQKGRIGLMVDGEIVADSFVDTLTSQMEPELFDRKIARIAGGTKLTHSGAVFR